MQAHFAGEQAGLDRLRYYLYGEPENGRAGPALHHYKDQRAKAVGVDNSTKLSPFLAVGVLSPRTVYQEVMR